MPARASFLTERYVRDHGVYTNWAEVAAGHADVPARAARGRLPHGAARQGAPHRDDDAERPSRRRPRRPRSTALGLRRGARDRRQVLDRRAEPRTPTISASAGCSTRTAQHIADRSYQGENETGRGATKRVPMWDATPSPLPARRLHRHLARRRRRALDRELRPRRAVLRCSSGSRARTTRGTRPRAAVDAVRRRRRDDAALHAAARRSTAPARTARLLGAFLQPLRHRHDDRRRDPRDAPRVLRQRLRHRRRRRPHRRRARRPRAARRHVGHLHERPRRDGRRPRPDVEVRALRAGGARAADRPAAGRRATAAVVDALVEHLDVPATVRASPTRPSVPESEGRSLLGYVARRPTPERRARCRSARTGASRRSRPTATSSSSTKTRVSPCQLFDLRDDPARTRTSRRPRVRRRRRGADGRPRAPVPRHAAGAPAQEPVHGLTVRAHPRGSVRHRPSGPEATGDGHGVQAGDVAVVTGAASGIGFRSPSASPEPA